MARLLALVFFSIMIMAAMALGTGALLGSADDGGAAQKAALLAANQPAESSQTTTEAGALIINRDNTGQFRLTAQVNGQDTRFLVDTGADVVAISIEEAERIGISVNPANFQPMMETAAGTGNGAAYEIDELIVAGQEFRNVEVIVLEGLKTNLLGQTVLSRLGRVELQGDRMTIGGD